MPGDRTEKASPRARQKAAERGDRAHSRDLMAGAAMLGGVVALGATGEKWVTGWAQAYRACLALGQPGFWERATAEETAVAIRGILLQALEPLAIVFAASLAGAVAAGVLQGGGWSLNFEALAAQAGAAESGGEREECFFSARRGAPGQIAGAGAGAGIFRGARDRGADRDSADEHGAVSGPVCRDVQPAGRCGVDFPGVGGQSTT